MISIKCDICSTVMVEQVLIVNIVGNDDVDTDVCSPECLAVLADYLGPDMQETTPDPEEDTGDQEPAKAIKIPKARLVPQERYPTEGEIEQITGVTKRY